MTNSIFTKYKNHLEGLGAAPELIKDFEGKYNISRSKDENMIRNFYIESCEKFNFTQPFEVDGRPRFSRNKHKGQNDSSRKDAIDENTYRRGYAQGFEAAIAMLEKENISISNIKEHYQKIDKWRKRPFQILDTLPGDDEGEANWFLIE